MANLFPKETRAGVSLAEVTQISVTLPGGAHSNPIQIPCNSMSVHTCVPGKAGQAVMWMAIMLGFPHNALHCSTVCMPACACKLACMRTCVDKEYISSGCTSEAAAT